MGEGSFMCYELGYCYFCKKLDCEKRVYKSSYEKTSVKMCNGNCFECKEAIRSSLYTKLYTMHGINKIFTSCLLYQYFAEMKNFTFFGRVGKVSEYSKIELAILQLKKCNDCEEKKKYFDMLEEITRKIKQIPHCFESKTELTSNNVLKITQDCICEVLEKEYECKIKIILKRLVKEYLEKNKAEEVDLEKLCDYIYLNQINIDYVIHPITIGLLLEK